MPAVFLIPSCECIYDRWSELLQTGDDLLGSLFAFGLRLGIIFVDVTNYLFFFGFGAEGSLGQGLFVLKQRTERGVGAVATVEVELKFVGHLLIAEAGAGMAGCYAGTALKMFGAEQGGSNDTVEQIRSCPVTLDAGGISEDDSYVVE